MLPRARTFLLVVPIAAALVVPFVSSCGSAGGGGDQGLNPNGDSSILLDGGDASNDGAGFDVKDKGAPTGLKIDPPTSTLTIKDFTAPPSETLTASATYADGTSAPVTGVSWSVDRFDIVSIGGGTGVVSAAGKIGGDVVVTAKVGALTATAKVTVNLDVVSDPAGSVPTGDKTKLSAGGAADPSVKSILYPYDKTVFPKGLLGPEVMWNGGAVGDEYLLLVQGPYTKISFFGLANPPSAMPIDTAAWNSLTSSVTAAGVGADVSVELRRLSGGVVYSSAKQTWHVANANVRGTIYYWAVNQGQIVKIKPGAASPTPAFAAGSSASLGSPVPIDSASAPTPPWQDNGAGQRCVACHAVSKDGSRLVGVWSTPRGSTGPVGLVDLASATTTAISDYMQNVTFDTLSPDGSKAVINTSDLKMHLLDGASGAAIASSLDGMANVADPMFSPDGKLLAFGGNVGGYYPVEFYKSDLQVMDFDGSAGFSGLRTLISSAGSGDAIAFPSFSPDSKWIFFQRGSYSRAKYGDPSTTGYLHGVDDLYAVSTAAGSAPIPLDNLNGVGVLSADNAHLNYQPTVNPIAEGGYFWVVFVSPRDYGNKMVSPGGAAPADCSYSNRKQLWVSAVDATMGPGDPSHPAFHLPGQALETINMNGYWTLEPCKPTPGDGGVASCSAGFECCSGFCRDTGSGPSCVDPPAGCHHIGEKCTVDADCCSGGKCTGGFCATSGPK